eukprot:TRINITY_DN43582_c0_g1_i1.p1 TRINITY_DN43582_c0_g1~~TRINITY_DN43582_c0_g1_i1.p1  ORF type:complete len:404 (-),score=45.60 TRINITY_DN43582_c0_g1_i1:45-1256(-)
MLLISPLQLSLLLLFVSPLFAVMDVVWVNASASTVMPLEIYDSVRFIWNISSSNATTSGRRAVSMFLSRAAWASCDFGHAVQTMDHSPAAFAIGFPGDVYFADPFHCTALLTTTNTTTNNTLASTDGVAYPRLQVRVYRPGATSHTNSLTPTQTRTYPAAPPSIPNSPSTSNFPPSTPSSSTPDAGHTPSQATAIIVPVTAGALALIAVIVGVGFLYRRHAKSAAVLPYQANDKDCPQANGEDEGGAAGLAIGRTVTVPMLLDDHQHPQSPHPQPSASTRVRGSRSGSESGPLSRMYIVSSELARKGSTGLADLVRSNSSSSDKERRTTLALTREQKGKDKAPQSPMNPSLRQQPNPFSEAGGLPSCFALAGASSGSLCFPAVPMTANPTVVVTPAACALEEL